MVTVSLSGCFWGKTDVLGRVQYWEQQLDPIVASGRNIAEVKSELDSLDIGYRDKPEENKLRFHELENIKAKEWYCESWSINGEVRYDSLGKVQELEIQNFGNGCL